jgi:hypothetical protein
MAKTLYQQVTSGFNPSSTIVCRPGFGAADSGRKHNAKCRLLVNLCRAISREARRLYPRKLPRQPFAIEAVESHERTHAMQQQSHSMAARTPASALQFRASARNE